MSSDFNEHLKWGGKIPNYCNGTLIGVCLNSETSLVELGVFYDSSIPGIPGAGYWLCESCFNIHGVGSVQNELRKNFYWARYELQENGTWLRTEGGKYYRNSPDKKMVNNKDKYGNTILHNIVITGDIEFVKFLLDVEGINLNIKNDIGKTARDLAIEIGNKEILNLFDRK